MSRFEGVVLKFRAAGVARLPGGCGSRVPTAAVAAAVLTLTALAGCTTDQTVTGSITPAAAKPAAEKVDAKQKQCLVRAMYFESNRSSPDGMLAVGSVVMNRVSSPQFPDTICGVVGQPHQFAPGVMSRSMTSSALPEIESVADEVIEGQRHKKVGDAMFFHTAGLHFPYHNMHYVAVAGGNAFYEKTGRYVTQVAMADTAVPAASADADAATSTDEAPKVAALAFAEAPSTVAVPTPMPSPQMQVAQVSASAPPSPRPAPATETARFAQVSQVSMRSSDAGNSDLPGVSTDDATTSFVDARIREAFATN